MKKGIYSVMLQSVCVIFLMFSINSCSNDTVTPAGPDANTVSGTITFADTNILRTGGFYDIGVFPNPSTPPAYWFGPPSSNDTLRYTKTGNLYTATFKLKGVSNGSYVVAVGFRTDTQRDLIMGVYGCDTSHSTCFFDPQRISVTNNQGVENVNFISWADTTKKVF